MIDNDCIFEIDVDLNLDHLSDLAFKQQTNSLEYQNLVSNDLYLTDLKKQFPFLSSKYNTYFLKPGAVLPIHIDAKRSCALNIPISNVDKSYTMFYKHIEEPKLEYVQEWIYHKVNSKVEEIFRFTLSKPTLINNAIPHSVVNYSDKTRIIISWSIMPEYSFNEIKSILKNESNKTIT